MPTKFPSFLVFVCFFFANAKLTAQWVWAQPQPDFWWGGQIGLSCDFGTHTNRLGLTLKTFLVYKFLQTNLQETFYYNFKSLGSQKKGWENQFRLGVLFATGKEDSLVNPFVDELGNQTQKRYSIGYSFNIYSDTWGTSQLTGTVGLGFVGMRLLMENDLLAFIPQDRFRTGGLGFSYWLARTQTLFSLTNINFTGNPYTWDTEIIRDDSLFRSRWGYIPMDKLPFGRFSLGALVLGVQQKLPFYQHVEAQIGVDAEQVRNAFQNRLVHDNIPPKFLTPKNPDRLSIQLKNPHFPMLCPDGSSYLYRPHQKIRKPKFFAQVGLNPASVFY